MKTEQENAIKPFWSWNDELKSERLCNQIETMKRNGIEGFFMHARGGLTTPYMGEKWFDMIKVCMDKADELGMQAWAYDENGWPSGFADGGVPARGEAFQQKRLVCEEWSGTENPDRVLGYYRREGGRYVFTATPSKDCIVIYYTVNQYYLDTFNPEAVRCFLDLTHEKYYERFGERFGTSLKGFFTDEPQYGGEAGVAWSQILPERFSETCGYDLIENLPLLYYTDIGYQKFRSDFYNVLSRTFRTSFIKQMYDWCTDHNCMLTGHLMCEDSLLTQIVFTGGVMSCYEYFHEPGIDWLGRRIDCPLTPKQLGSVAAQLERKTLTESFALCGWDVSLNELKWIAQWQYVNGVTSLCPHLEGYSMRGLRKRDYPASLFTQLPWFEECYNDFAKYFTSLGQLLDSGKDYAPLLVIHGMQSAYTVHDPHDFGALTAYQNKFTDDISKLANQHILHHYGDEDIMLHYGSVEGATLKIGACSYDTVFLPHIINLTSNTVKLLTDFAQNGGKIYAMGYFPTLCEGEENKELAKLCEKITMLWDIDTLSEVQPHLRPVSVETDGLQNSNIHLCVKMLQNGTELYYLVNHSNEKQTVTLRIKDSISLCECDMLSNTTEQLRTELKNGNTVLQLTFGAYGSHILTSDTAGAKMKTQAERANIMINKTLDITDITPNTITLDYCSFRIDGGQWQESKAVILLQKQLLDLRRPCDVEMKFSFKIEEDFDYSSLELCLETPLHFILEINGRSFDFDDCGYYIDEDIRCCKIGDFVCVGENSIVMKCKFYQSDNVYRVLYTPNICETERNKLTLDTELESIYLRGNFSVKMHGDWKYDIRRCIRAGREFSLAALGKRINSEQITQEGFWFFSGRMTLGDNVTIEKKDGVRYYVVLKALYSPAAAVIVNGERAGMMEFSPFEVDVTDLIKNGENLIEIQLYSGNRNLLGPHHRLCGESYMVGPSTFTAEPVRSDNSDESQWTDDYSFVRFGIEV